MVQPFGQSFGQELHVSPPLHCPSPHIPPPVLVVALVALVVLAELLAAWVLTFEVEPTDAAVVADEAVARLPPTPLSSMVEPSAQAPATASSTPSDRLRGARSNFIDRSIAHTAGWDANRSTGKMIPPRGLPGVTVIVPVLPLPAESPDVRASGLSCRGTYSGSLTRFGERRVV